MTYRLFLNLVQCSTGYLTFCYFSFKFHNVAHLPASAFLCSTSSVLLQMQSDFTFSIMYTLLWILNFGDMMIFISLKLYLHFKYLTQFTFTWHHKYDFSVGNLFRQTKLFFSCSRWSIELMCLEKLMKPQTRPALGIFIKS